MALKWGVGPGMSSRVADEDSRIKVSYAVSGSVDLDSTVR
jgi:hypothetical protein